MLPTRGSVAAVAARANAQPSLRILAVAAVASIVALAFVVTGAGRASADVMGCQYVLGFETLHGMIPDSVGDCVDNEQHDSSDGITRQQDTTWTL